MTMPLAGRALSDALSGLGFDGSTVRWRASVGGEDVWEIDARTGDWFTDWRRLRDAVPTTGRWPVAVTSLTLGPTGVVPGSVDMDRLVEVDVDAALDGVERGRFADDVAEAAELHQDETREAAGEAPGLAEVLAGVGERATDMALERWFRDWELEHAPGLPLGEEAPYLSWFEPGEPVQLLLLPRPEPWAAACYVGSYESEWPSPEVRPALFRRWALAFGAEPAANWGTMQQLVVRRPPADLASAWEVARAQALLWGNTVYGPGVTVRQLARDLVGRERWFLHCRP